MNAISHAISSSTGRRLAGRRILISGGASGIGFATARRFIIEGAQVALFDKNAPLLEAAIAQLGKYSHAFTVDLTEPEAIAPITDKAANALGGIDGIVNAAGISLRKHFDATSFKEWRQVLAINLDAVFLVCQAALPWLRQAGSGTIVNIASGASMRPSPDFSAYCASKGGVAMLSKALAMDLAADKIRVNALCPGVIYSPMVERSLARADNREAAIRAYLQKRVMNRFGTVDEVADAALFLTSNESTFITGSSLVVDGGATFH